MRRLSHMSLALLLLAVFTAVGVSASASGPADLPYTAIDVGCAQAGPTAGQAVIPITATNVGGDGVVGFQLNLNYNHSTMSFVSIANGSSVSALGCSFTTSRIGTVGDVDFISGTCTSSIPRPGATGASVELAKVTLNIPSAPFQVSLDVNPSGGYPTGLIGPNANTPPTGGILYPATAGQLTACTPTAVTMSGFDATSDSPAPFAAAAWPLLAGAAAVAAGGAYALLRRKS